MCFKILKFFQLIFLLTLSTVSKAVFSQDHLHANYLEGTIGNSYQELDHEPHYDFEYYVNDPHTKDVKNHKESRKGDKVIGMYSVVEPDGIFRIVEYTVDGPSGFKATVRRENSKNHLKQYTPHNLKNIATYMEVQKRK